MLPAPAMPIGRSEFIQAPPCIGSIAEGAPPAYRCTGAPPCNRHMAPLSFRRGGQISLRETTMGLLDVLNGMQNGPRGPSKPSTGSDSGGMSPMTMAILALLAWKAVKHFGGSQPGAAPGSAPPQVPSPKTINAGMPGGAGGGLSDLLKGGLGGLLAGGAAGSILSGGLGDVLKQLQQGGQGDAANSWVGKGENKPISPGDLGSALGAD